MRLVVISGRSGSGKSSALHVLEDLGFYCINNLPVELLPSLAMTPKSSVRSRNLAVSIDVRNLPQETELLTHVLTELPRQFEQVDIVFLDASEDSLLQRFSSTRRKHPLTDDYTSLAEAITLETKLLDPIVNLADLTLDTTHMSVHELRNLIKLRIAERQSSGMAVLFQSFGFKHGIPTDADYVFDVRNLPNPYWNHDLRGYTGQDQPVIHFLENNESVHKMFQDITHFLENWLPELSDNNRSYLTVAIGCTGGQHRSVYMTERLAQHFKQHFDNVQIRHRELVRAKISP
jgi:UPF0042 nucleotide-binding protein